MGIEVTERQLADMHDVSHVDAKRGGTFRPDSEEKRTALNTEVRSLVEQWAMPPYRRLEALRVLQNHPVILPHERASRVDAVSR